VATFEQNFRRVTDGNLFLLIDDFIGIMMMPLD
jgi:hypothetical protein